ncbi:major facilitator superfamily domain-containing protein [Microdochium trichocladiopsis]|uniref:Major facilitator superfamily domain-containing protein n=1 Tax=Microdochium trichocladiopsis TaxID=1682393 RepID=A0A9P9BP77_9PEZI|nr:major facilitator superfamily domain-containing protein [Microdochium trichocladiopsis]KAH7028989.1 major facilitator superfamily domain-containing protein [Microdochium trichocladiopsis]
MTMEKLETAQYHSHSDTKEPGHHDNNNAIPPSPYSSLPPPAPPPASPYRAWAQVVVAHLGSFNSWGYMNSFGLFQSYYATSLLPPTTAPSSISWIGSIQIFLAFGVGSVSGRALDAGHLRAVVLAGCCLQILAIMTASVSTEYYQLLLTQGLCKGLGDGLVFCPTVANVPTYFPAARKGGKRAVAMGVAASGTATGGIVFPLIAQRLMPSLGYGWTVRVMGFIVLFNAAVMLALVRPRKSVMAMFNGLFDWSAFRDEPAYALFCAGMFCAWLALYFAFYYVTPFGKTFIGIDTSLSLTLLLIMNAIGAPSRVLFGVISDRLLGPLRALILAVSCTGAVFYAWTAVRDLPALVAFCCLYGFFAAACQGLFPATCANLTADPKKMGARTGMAFAVVSVATLVGPPIGGALVQARQGGEYLYAQVFGGSVLVFGAALLVLSGWTNCLSRIPKPEISEVHKAATAFPE